MAWPRAPPVLSCDHCQDVSVGLRRQFLEIGREGSRRPGVVNLPEADVAVEREMT